MRPGADDLELVAVSVQQRERVDQVVHAVPLHQPRHREAAGHAVGHAPERHPRAEPAQVHAVLHHRVAEPRVGPLRQPSQALGGHDHTIGAMPDPAGEGVQQQVRPLHAAKLDVIAGNVRAPQRHDHRHPVQIEQGQHGRGGEREDEVDHVVSLALEQAPDHRHGGGEIPHRSTHAGLVGATAVTRDAVHGEHAFRVGLAVPEQPGIGRGVIAAGHHVH